MNILVEGEPLLSRGGGIRRYMISLIHALSTLDSSKRLWIGDVAPRLFEAGDFGGVSRFEFGTRLDHQVLGLLRDKPVPGLARKLWKRRRARIARATRRQAEELGGAAFWGLTPLPRSDHWRALPTIATVHDLHYLWDLPGLKSRSRSRLEQYHPEYIARAQHVVAVSEWTRQDIIHRLGVPGPRISVIPNAVGSEFRPLESHGDPAPQRRRLGLPERYLLHVGSLQPRKNLARLIRAHRILLQRGHDLDLILCGQSSWLADEILAEAANPKSRGRVHIRDDIGDLDLVYVYNLADVFVMPSLLEGFGIPALEAMACGTPVVASRAAALPGVVGDAAILVDPEDEPGIADAVEVLLEAPEMREHLRTLGLRRAAAFSWQSSAMKLAKLFETFGGRRLDRAEFRSRRETTHVGGSSVGELRDPELHGGGRAAVNDHLE